MRRADLVPHVTEQIRTAFPEDVAAALLSEPEIVQNLARHLNELCDGDADTITTAIVTVADKVEESLLDWMVDNPHAAASTLYNEF